MKSRRNSKSEENRAAAASLLADLEEEFSVDNSKAVSSIIQNDVAEATTAQTYGKPTEAVSCSNNLNINTTTTTAVDFSYYEEDERQPLNIIAKNFQKVGTDHQFKVDKIEVPDSVNTAQTDNKQVTIEQQTGNNVQGKEITNRQQTDNKQATKIDDIPAAKIETDNKQVTKRVTERITIEQQTDNKRITISGFEALVGNEKNLLILIFEECLRIGSLTSPEFTLSHISECLEISPGVAKMVIYRLIKKGFIERASSKTGRGGWIKFSIKKDLYQDLRIRQTDNKQVTIEQQTDNKQVTKRVTERITSAPCSSSSNLNINNTTTTDGEFWLSVPRNLEGMVSVRQLRDFVKQELITVEELQSSLDGFAYDLEKGTVRAKNGNPIAILIGAIKGGGYISQQYISELKVSLAEIEKARAELHQLQSESVALKLKEEFADFCAKYPEQAAKLRPSGAFIKSFEPGSVGYRMWLDEYLKSQVVQPALISSTAEL